MKVAVLGGGFAGLSAAFYISKKGHKVTVFEKEKIPGGLAVGFKQPTWNWYMERAVHHLFTNDLDIRNFAKEAGFDKIDFRTPFTESLYGTADNYRIIPVDTPQDFLRFPLLPMTIKLRTAFVLAFLKFSPFLPLYEKISAEQFLRKTMGNRAWEVLWSELFRKKFVNYAGNIVTSFIWSRIKKRTKKLGYIRGGFQSLIDHLLDFLPNQGVDLRLGIAVNELKKKGDKFLIEGEEFDAIVSTLPTPILIKLGSKVFDKNYLDRLSGIKYLHAVSVVVETDKPLLERTYWLNVCASDNKIMGMIQHTNFVDPKNYNNKNLCYVYNYVDFNHELIRASDKEVFDWYTPEIKKVNESFNPKKAKYYVFKGPFAQPIFDKDFLKRKPDFITPVKNFFIANLDMTYPHDRGTNYAVKLGREVSNFF